MDLTGWAASSIKLVMEVAIMAMAGRAVLAMLAGAGHAANPFWRILNWLCEPFLALVRRLSGQRLQGAGLSLVTGLMLLLLWGVATVAKIAWCVRIGVAACQ